VPTVKWVTSVTTNVLTGGAALLVTHFGLHLSAGEQGWISGVIAIAAGAAASYWKKERPVVVKDL
jgi:hypothetical protein